MRLIRKCLTSFFRGVWMYPVGGLPAPYRRENIKNDPDARSSGVVSFTGSDDTAQELDDSRCLFQIPPGIAYLNTANIGPRLRIVSESGHEAIERFSVPWEIKAADWFSGAERLRKVFSELIAVDADSVALVPSVSYGIAVAAKNIDVPRGSEVVVVKDQYPSNFYIWRRRAAEEGATIRVAQRSESLSLTDALLGLIGRDTSVVAVPHCHWTDGELIDLAAVSDAARSVDSALIIDASQSLGALPFDFRSFQPDFVVSVGYKWLLGPYGLGYLYVAERWRAEGVPLEESWLTRKGSEDFSRLVDYVDEYRPGARRFDFGEFPQFISLPMATAAISQLAGWGVNCIHQALMQRTTQVRRFAESFDLYSLPEDRCAGHMIALRLPGGIPEGMLEKFKSRSVHVSVRGDRIRVAPHLHNNDADMDSLFEAVESVVD